MASMIKFYTKPALNKVKSAEAGYAVYEDVDYCMFIKPGGSQIELRVTEEWLKQKKINRTVNMINQHDPDGSKEHEMLQKAWDNYKNGRELKPDGMPVEEWGMIGRSEAEILKGLGMFTVEQLAESDDNFFDKYGGRGHELAKKAAAFLKMMKDGGKSTEKVVRLEKENEALKSEMGELKGELDKMKVLLDHLGDNKQESRKKAK